MRNPTRATEWLARAAGVVALLSATGATGGSCAPDPEPSAGDVCQVAADCEGMSHARCLGAWQCVEGQCAWDCGAVGCSSNTDCPEGQTCIDGNCTGSQAGCVASGCSGEICGPEPVESACIWLDWFTCLKYTTCGLQADGSCGFAKTAQFQACLDGAAGCSSDAECPVGRVCVEGQCIESQPPACTVDSDCLPGEFCELQPGCGMYADGAGSSEAAPCQLQGVCRPRPASCQTDQDCKTGFHCESYCACVDCGCLGTCVADPPPPFCTVDSDCLPGQFCELQPGCGPYADAAGEGAAMPCQPQGVCKPRPVSCQTDQDCKTGFHCESYCACVDCGCAGTCVADPTGCWSDSECPVGMYCMMYKCGTDGTDEKCYGPGTCQPRECLPETCDGVDNDCDGQVDEDCNGECRTDADCPPGQLCYRPSCTEPCACSADDPACTCPSCFGDGPGYCGPGCTAEICGDGFDNDCDGAVDETCSHGCGADTDCPPGQACRLYPCDCGCGTENPECDCACEAWGECYPIECYAEQCGDGLDNDCDGQVDEDCGGQCTSDRDCAWYESCEVLYGGATMPGCCVPLPDGTGCPEGYPYCGGICVLRTGYCFDDATCGSGYRCEGAIPTCDCPDGALCKCAPPQPGKCVPTDLPRACMSDADCLQGEFCPIVLSSRQCCPPTAICSEDIPPCVCEPLPGHCRDDGDCAAAEHCEGTSRCLPDGICLDEEAIGKCVPDTPSCRAVKPGSHGDCRMVIGVIWDGVQCVAESGCGCEPDCDAVFATEAECWMACVPTPGCTDDSACAYGEVCMNGLCVAREGTCYADSDCPTGQKCEWTACPDGFDCLVARPGHCVSSGGCSGDAECAVGEYCSLILDPATGQAFGSCVPLGNGQCVRDEDCGAGQACRIDACPACYPCPCFGTCEAARCQAMKPGSHGACEMILGVIFDGQTCVYESGCGCGDDCAFIFPDFETCRRSCFG